MKKNESRVLNILKHSPLLIMLATMLVLLMFTWLKTGA
jgi:hypothetical protein